MKRLSLLLLGLALAVPALAAPVDFVREVRPIFEHRCYECHGEKKQKSGLRLDVKVAAMKGGDDHGACILAGQAEKSPLIELVTSTDKDERMPPKGEALTATEIATLQRWIAEGAVWPDSADLVKLEDRRDHWAFKPLTHPVPPEIGESAWARGAIDQFIFAKLKQAGLHPSPETDRVSWLRRVTLDLTGLPPTPEQVSAFVNDQAYDAYERVADRLLASPRYGECWAQHWLDVVRYADTHGFEVNTERPNAWPYRDYVIRAFNADTPYDRFIREQIVGDATGQDAATGFLVTASVLLPGQIGKDEPSKRLARQDSIDEIVTNIGQTFLGLSIGCARCHDHKFDPILQREYYSMQAFVAGVEYEERPLRTPEAEAARKESAGLKEQISELDRRLSQYVPLAKSGTERPAITSRKNVDRFAPVAAKRLRFTIRATNTLPPSLDEIEVYDPAGKNVALASEGTVPSASSSVTVADRHDLSHVNDGLYGNPHSWLSNDVQTWVALEFPSEITIDRVVWSRDREGKFTDRTATDYTIEVAGTDGEWHTVADASDRRKFDPEKHKEEAPFSIAGLTESEAKEATRLHHEREALEQKLTQVPSDKVFAGAFRTPDEIHLLNRGDPEQPKELTPPAVPAVLGTLNLPQESTDQARRQALADWIADARNPLTARVMVNRIWQGHFGTGLVETPSDFGRTGAKPSHPELLDWLAQEFIRGGWSVKHLHRLIVLSATYRQESRIDPAAQARDAEARLLWRYPARRIEAENIRDSMLAVSGRLNPKMFGRGFDLFNLRGGLTGFTPVESFTGEGLRRMIYAHKVRREREAVFGAFDCPDAGQSTARRRESTTPIQALDLFNSRFTLEQAQAFAARVQSASGSDEAEQVRRAYEFALNRAPSPVELGEATPVVHAHGMATLCRALFNSNEFLYLP